MVTIMLGKGLQLWWISGDRSRVERVIFVMEFCMLAFRFPSPISQAGLKMLIRDLVFISDQPKVAQFQFCPKFGPNNLAEFFFLQFWPKEPLTF